MVPEVGEKSPGDEVPLTSQGESAGREDLGTGWGLVVGHLGRTAPAEHVRELGEHGRARRGVRRLGINLDPEGAAELRADSQAGAFEEPWGRSRVSYDEWRPSLPLVVGEILDSD